MPVASDVPHVRESLVEGGLEAVSGAPRTGVKLLVGDSYFTLFCFLYSSHMTNPDALKASVQKQKAQGQCLHVTPLIKLA